MLHSINCFYVAINITILKYKFSFVFIDRCVVFSFLPHLRLISGFLETKLTFCSNIDLHFNLHFYYISLCVN